MYGFEYELEPASEGIKETFKNIIETVGRKISEVSTWLRNKIISIGKWLKGDKSDFAPNDGNAKQLISKIGNNTEKLILECSKSINTMYNAYFGMGNVAVLTGNGLDSSEPIFKNGANRVYDTFNYKDSHMMRRNEELVDKNTWDKFQEVFGKLFTTMHKDADDIKKDLLELKNMPPLSYNTTLEGYKQLKDLYNANGKFGKEWSQLRTAHEFANDGPIKKALSKIVSMYSVGINAAKEFANRLRFGKFRDNSGNKYAINADERKQAKSEYKNGGKIVKADDKIAYISKNHAFTSAEILEKLGSKESAMLSELYDIAYEDARRDLEMKAEYIRAFESVPDAFDEFETEI